MWDKFPEVYMQLFCTKNSDGTKSLCLKGRDMWQRTGKRINDDDMDKIVKFLNDNLDVVKLDLCYNDIGDDGISILVDGYFANKNHTLQHLNLVGCNITGKGIQSLSNVAKEIQLKTLRINGNKLGFEGGKYAGKLLYKCHSLENFDVGDSDQTLASINYIIGAICNNVTNLRVLDLSRIIPISDIYLYDPAHITESLSYMLKINTSLIELHIQKNEFDGHDIELLLDGLKRNNTLLLLDVGFNRIGDYGTELLSNWLKNRPQTLGLNIAGNRVTKMGARALSFALPYSKIRLLDISYNHINDYGMIDILNTIKKPYMLRMFYFWGNNIHHSTLKIIFRMLRSGVFNQELIDVKPYKVDGCFQAAYYPANHYKHRYYCVMDHGCPIPLRIKRNKIEQEFAQPRALIRFEYYDRFPQVDNNLPPKPPICEDIPCPCFKNDYLIE